ncbi:MAG: hypothetical protein ACRD88_22010 [Terriglobia bacterium]
MSHTLLLPAASAVPAGLSVKEELFRPATSLSYGHVRAQLAPGLTLFVGKPLASPLALPFCAPWLEQGKTVIAVDGANCFNLYRLTEWAKRKRLDSPALLQRLRIARAFTPFQLATILHHIGSDLDRHRATRLVITGLPDCLYDEELSEAEARTTFARCRTNLLRLAERHTVLAFSDAPVSTGRIGGRMAFLDALISEARLVLEAHPTEPETTSICRFAFVPVKAPGLLTIPKETEEA